MDTAIRQSLGDSDQYNVEQLLIDAAHEAVERYVIWRALKTRRGSEIGMFREADFSLTKGLVLHAFVRNKQGQITDRVMYSPESLTSEGIINGRPVRCIAAAYMVQFIAPWLYKLRNKDFHDVAVLCEKFDIAYPEEYKRDE